MKITDIVQTQRNKQRYSIFLDDVYWNAVDADIILANHLQIGMELDASALTALFNEKLFRDTRERAYRLLENRAHSKKELYDKLLRDAPPEICTGVITLLCELGFLDDSAYANQLAEYFLQRKLWGVRKAVMEMQRRGVSREIAEEAVSSCEVDTVSQICIVIEKKYYRSDLTDYKEKQRVIAALSRLGFVYSDIREALDRVTTETEELEDDE